MKNPKFRFSLVSFEQTLDEINNLNPTKASQTKKIPVPIIKGKRDVIVLFIYHNFNNSLSSSSFPNGLKYANVRTVFNKDNKTVQLALFQT